MSPLISIITPVYNRPELLRKAISSVLAQTHRNFEYIVVDDASTEDVKSIVLSFKDSRIKYLRNPINKMMAATYNVGIGKAKGEYIAFLESDDEWLPTKLEKQLKLFEANKEVGVVYCGRYLVDEKGEVLSEDWPKHKGNISKICLGQPLLAPTVLMIKKEIGDKVNWFDSNLPGWNDWDLLIRLSKITKFDFVNELLVKYRIHSGQLTGKILEGLPKKIKFYNLIYNKHMVEYNSHPKINSNILRTIGTLCCRIGQSKQGREFFRKAIKLYPTRFKNYRSFIVSFFPTRFFNFLYFSSLELRGKRFNIKMQK